jgi:hypothetical protein
MAANRCYRSPPRKPRRKVVSDLGGGRDECSMYDADPPLRRSMPACFVEKQAPARFPLLKPESIPTNQVPEGQEWRNTRATTVHRASRSAASTSWDIRYLVDGGGAGGRGWGPCKWSRGMRIASFELYMYWTVSTEYSSHP